LDIVAHVYESVVDAGVHRAPSIKVAEAAKVIENTQRDLNISLVNELAIIFNKMEIDTRDVLEAAGSKWNFLPFDPGLVGGHCIGVDPYYLTYQAERLGYSPQVILAGRRINDGMGKYVADQLIKQIIKSNSFDKKCIVTILGFTFKENVPDLRNTRVIDIINELNDYDINVQVHDPIADKNEAREEYGIELLDSEKLLPAHAVILAVPHNVYMDENWTLVTSKLIEGRGVVIDVRAKLNRDKIPPDIIHWRL
jgi:UDP-N-acetyl-D-galactosamine dehydrogenase